MKSTWTRKIAGLLFLLVPGAVTAAERPAVSAAAPRTELQSLVIAPAGRILIQRGFVPFEGSLKLYACVVGSPQGVHYAYDFESGALLSVWRGPFADMTEIWGPRARNQTARPAGHEMTLTAKPLVAQFSNRAMIEFPKAWPDQPSPLYTSLGYELEDGGQPVFLARFEHLFLRDRISATRNNRGLERRIEFAGVLSPWETWLLLGEADEITALAEGRGWSGGQWALEWPPESPHRPVVRTAGSRQLLVVRIEATHLDVPMQYRLRW